MNESIPIGKPIKYQPNTIIIHTNEKSNIIGIIFFIILIIPTLESFSYLHINPIVIIRYTYIGENNFPIESATKNNVWVKAGLILALINNGT